MPRIRTLALVACLLPASVTGAPAQDETTEEELLGAPSSLLIEEDPEPAVRIEAGTKLHRDPHPHAPVVTVVDVTVELRPLERLEGWVRVRFAERIGWATLAGAAPAESPPELAPPAAPAAPELEALAADQERLARALSFLGERATVLEAGAFRLHTDVKGQHKRQTLATAAFHLADAYRERYGLSGIRLASFAVVIFERAESYRRFENTVAGLARLGAEGHAGSGVAALVAEKRTAAEAAALLVHELAHLLNRQTFRGSLPPWLEEGIANDLAYCRLDRSGRLQLGTLGGKGFIAEVPGPPDRFGRRAFAGTVHIEGPLASLSLLKRRLADDQLIPLPELLDLTWSEFVAPEGRELRYIQSTFFVRYLLDELDVDGFRGFLAAFQAGGEADAATLLKELGTGWDELTAGFEEWTRRQTGRD